MAKTVFVLGAGASKEAGAPLMSEFLDRANSLDLSKHEKEDIDNVFKAIQKLKVVHYNSYVDLDNIETVFGLIEMGTLINRLADVPLNELEGLKKSIQRLIVQTLDLSLKMKIDPENTLRQLPAPCYHKFASTLKDKNAQAFSVITFNYDMVIDYAFRYYGIPIDYCLEEVQNNQALKLLKLHGSLNWGKCECGTTYVLPWDKFKYTSSFLTIGATLLSQIHCENKTIEPVLVPPTWNKGAYHSELRNVWRQAAKELSEAENIFIIGYSLPESDIFFKYLFALGTVGKAFLKKIWVYNPDPAVENRFKALIGKGIEKKFKFIQKPFSEVIYSIFNIID
ncbi:MAG: SIR2 family protein [Planctomycetes bacterium]|nr:SIR2 family protein [Planctomycetota bacterium]